MVLVLSVSVLLFAFSFNLSKLGLLYAKPYFFVGLRSLVAGSFFIGTLLLIQRKKIKIQKRDYLLFARVAIFLFLLSGSMFMWSMQYLSSGKGAFIYNLMPFIFAIISYFYLSEHMSAKKWLAIAIGFAGSIPMLLAKNPTTITSQWVSIWPTIINLLGVICYCYGMVVIRKLVKYRGYPPSLIVGSGLLAAGIVEMSISLIKEGLLPVEILSPFFIIFLALVFMNDVLFNYLYASLLKRYTATFLSLVMLMGPLISSLIGWLFLKERLSWVFVPALVCSVIGLAIFYTEERRLNG